MERTLIIVKPDGVQRGLIGSVLGRFERRGSEDRRAEDDAGITRSGGTSLCVHQGKPFFEGLVDFITSSPVVVGVLEGPNAIEMTRDTVGATNPAVGGSRHHSRGFRSDDRPESDSRVGRG